MPDASSHRPLLLGHRGARAQKSIPENTLASFDQALADGCDGFEFDVRLAGDGTAVICHDSRVKETEVARAAAEDLPGLARLEQVVERYQDSAFLDIELKVSGLEKITAALLRKYQPHRGFVVSSFLPEVLQAMRAEDSAIPLGLICETRAELRRWNQLAIEYLMPQRTLANPALISQLKGAGKKILVWTINARADMRRLADSGVDGIISDDTSLLCRTLAK